jgi:hypothetical protein
MVVSGGLASSLSARGAGDGFFALGLVYMIAAATKQRPPAMAKPPAASDPRHKFPDQPADTGACQQQKTEYQKKRLKRT